MDDEYIVHRGTRKLDVGSRDIATADPDVCGSGISRSISPSNRCSVFGTVNKHAQKTTIPNTNYKMPSIVIDRSARTNILPVSALNGASIFTGIESYFPTRGNTAIPTSNSGVSGASLKYSS